MSANINAIFVGTPKMPSVRNPTANTNRDGATGTYTSLYTAGSAGSFFRGVRIQYDTAPVAGDVVRLFYQPSGGTLYLLKEIVIPANNPGTSGSGSPPTQEIASHEWLPPTGIMMGASDVLKVTTDQGKGNIVYLIGGGDY